MRIVERPAAVDAHVLRALLEKGSAEMVTDRQEMRKGDCFLFGHGRYAQCTSCHPFYDEGMRSAHTLSFLSEEEAFHLLEGERVEMRRKDAAKIRSIADVLRRYDDPNDLIPELMFFADDFEGSAE